MYSVALSHPADLEGWRAGARALLAAGVEPALARWQLADRQGDLFAASPPPAAAVDAPAATGVPRAFVELAGTIVRHRAEDRFDLLYRLLWRQAHGERSLLGLRTDPDVMRALALARQVRQDAYHMRAYVRFREADDGSGTHYLAWFEPEHHVVELAAPHFIDRMGGLRWSILTPLRTAHWDGGRLLYGAGCPTPPPHREDGVVECWKTYYASIFNPARLKVDAMLAQMPKKYWGAMAETALIPDMVRSARARSEAMVAAAPTAPATRGRVRLERKPDMSDDAPADLQSMRSQLPACRRCELWRHATQPVPGMGPEGAGIMLVGEQPGDQEDLAGAPFVGPAGQVLDRALAEAGIDRASVYVTNAVKHFKYEPRGKRRLHQKPDAAEVTACRWWLDHELALVRPRLVVALGATAALGLLQREVPISRLRGQVLSAAGRDVLVTYHPSAVLRQPDTAAKARLFRALADDLSLAARLAA